MRMNKWLAAAAVMTVSASLAIAMPQEGKEGKGEVRSEEDAEEGGERARIGTGREESFFASTKQALEVVERFLDLKLRKREVGEGRLVVIAGGRELARERFKPDRNFEESSLPAVRAPYEGAFCLQRLAALAAL